MQEFVGNPDLMMFGGGIEVFPSNVNRCTSIELYELAFAFDQQRYIEQRHYGATANVMARREAFDYVGPFNGRLTSGGDKEFGLRLYDSGYKMAYSHASIVRHPARKTFGQHIGKLKRVTKGTVEIRDGSEEGRRLLSLQPKSSVGSRLKIIRQKLAKYGSLEKAKILGVVLLTFIYTRAIYSLARII